ncbi:hypothetical protein CFBP5875_03455 [Agrobacterium pusense]|uniref:hypothetical protein n=1 Tax=Agrobacterium TaxID=357 RepID=UPI000F671831|nr:MULTISPECIES: hypothetical protein [Rhizobium/Agrobacterium group]MDH0113105.1 hypothetical protein [Agrobacterium pusense]QCL83701.1 hypothetical protein CFBP5875_03455 [Agrobacterium pusense]
MHSKMKEHISQLIRLVADLGRLQSGSMSAPSIMAVPILDLWAYSFRKVPSLDGNVEGHPSLPNGDRIMTSELFAHFHSEDEHFVRTRSRWYRLGSPNQITKQRKEPTGSGFEG